MKNTTTSRYFETLEARKLMSATTSPTMEGGSEADSIEMHFTAVNSVSPLAPVAQATNVAASE